MKLIDTKGLPTLEKLPGWYGKLFHSEAMTFAHWQFHTGAVMHEHSHEQEEVWHVMQDELEAGTGTGVDGDGTVFRRADDAEDFADEDELIEDESPEVGEEPAGATVPTKGFAVMGAALAASAQAAAEDEDYDFDEDEPPSTAAPARTRRHCEIL